MYFCVPPRGAVTRRYTAFWRFRFYYCTAFVLSKIYIVLYQRFDAGSLIRTLASNTWKRIKNNVEGRLFSKHSSESLLEKPSPFVLSMSRSTKRPSLFQMFQDNSVAGYHCVVTLTHRYLVNANAVRRHKTGSNTLECKITWGRYIRSIYMRVYVLPPVFDGWHLWEDPYPSRHVGMYVHTWYHELVQMVVPCATKSKISTCLMSYALHENNEMKVVFA